MYLASVFIIELYLFEMKNGIEWDFCWLLFIIKFYKDNGTKKLMNLQNRFSKLNVAVARFSEEY